MSNRTRIEIYTRQRTSLSVLYGPCVLRCEQCGVDVLMLSPEGAVDVLHVTTAKIAELTAAGVLHTTMTPSNALLICSNSILTAAANAEKTQEKTS